MANTRTAILWSQEGSDFAQFQEVQGLLSQSPVEEVPFLG